MNNYPKNFIDLRKTAYSALCLEPPSKMLLERNKNKAAVTQNEQLACGH